MTLSQPLHINNQFLLAWGPPTPFPHLVVGKGERVGRDQTPPIPGNGGKRWETVGLWEQEPSKTSQQKVEEEMTTTSTTPTYEYQLAHHFQANYAHQFRHVTNLGWHKHDSEQWQPDTTGQAQRTMHRMFLDTMPEIPDTYHDRAQYYATNLDQALTIAATLPQCAALAEDLGLDTTPFNRHPKAVVIRVEPSPTHPGAHLVTINCPLCDQTHTHGLPEGHHDDPGYRVPHCINPPAYVHEQLVQYRLVIPDALLAKHFA